MHDRRPPLFACERLICYGGTPARPVISSQESCAMRVLRLGTSAGEW